MKFVEPVVEIISLHEEDVIITSPGPCFCIGDPVEPETKPM